MNKKLVLVTGAGGFIGGSLVASFREKGYSAIRAVDVKPLDHWYQKFDDVENLSLDLSNEKENCEVAAKGASEDRQPRCEHGWDGLHREEQGSLHVVSAD